MIDIQPSCHISFLTLVLVIANPLKTPARDRLLLCELKTSIHLSNNFGCDQYVADEI